VILSPATIESILLPEPGPPEAVDEIFGFLGFFLSIEILSPSIISMMPFP